MAFTRGKDNLGKAYLVDWEKVSNLVAAHAYLRAFTKNASPGRENGIKTVEFDHKLVRKEKQRYINETIPLVVQTIQADYTRGQGLLISLRNQTEGYRATRDELFASAEASAKRFEWWMDKAIGTTQLVRDTGFASLAVIAAPVGGAWAIGAVGVSAAGATWGKYQDTENVGSAMIAGAGSLVMAGWGSVTGAMKLAGAAKGVVVGMGCIFDSTFEMMGSVVEGKSGDEAARAGILKLITGGLGAGIDASKYAKQLDGLWEKLDHLKATVSFNEAAARMSIEAAKKGTDKLGGAMMDQATIAKKAAAQQNALMVRQDVLKAG